MPPGGRSRALARFTRVPATGDVRGHLELLACRSLGDLRGGVVLDAGPLPSAPLDQEALFSGLVGGAEGGWWVKIKWPKPEPGLKHSV